MLPSVRLKCSEKAIVDFSIVIDREPRNALAFFHRGQAYFERYNFGNAISDLVESIHLDKKRPGPYELLGTISLLNPDDDEKLEYRSAVEHFQKAREYCADFQTETRLMLFEATAQYIGGKYATALVLLRQIESKMGGLRGRAWYDLQQKLEIFRKLSSKIEVPTRRSYGDSCTGGGTRESHM